MDYENISKRTMNLLYVTRASLSKSPLDQKIRALVELRVSQINDCSYCCRLHAKEAIKAGFSQEQLDQLPEWQNTSLFDEKQKLALSWSESVTKLEENQDDLKSQLMELFDEREFVDLTITISLMNTLNRIAIALRKD